MSQITITITIDVPDGATMTVGSPTAATRATQPTVAPVAQASAPTELWPAGECPKHHKPWKEGTYGLFCTSRDEGTPKGYCILKPGDVFQGRIAA